LRKYVSAALAAALLIAMTGVASAQEATSSITVVHGVPGLTVDGYVNGELTLESFAPGDVAGPLELPAGEYDVAITAAGDSIDNALLTVTAPVPSGINATVVVHLDADGNPATELFVNDTSETAAGRGRLVVRHTAAAPELDMVLPDGSAVFLGLANTDEASSDLDAGTYEILVGPAGATAADVVFGGDVTVVEGSITAVYAIGDLEGGSFAVVFQEIPIVAATAATPAAVPSGSGDLSSEINAWAIALAIIAAAGLLVFGRAAYVRHR
jgi:hypothetical protein